MAFIAAAVVAALGCEASRRGPPTPPPSPPAAESASPAPDAAAEDVSPKASQPAPARRPLVNACSSARELAEKALDALRRRDPRALGALRVTEAEYKTYLFPEFPAAAPNRTIPVDFHWGYLDVRSLHGIEEAIESYGGRDFELLDVIPTKGIDSYKTYRLLNKVELDVRDRKTDEILRIKVFGSVVELDGQYKILGFPT